MGLRINTNTNAVTALRNLRLTDKALAGSLQRLSTGLRINAASDDPAGLVISEQFRAQIRSTEQAIENTQFDSNLIGTAEAALQEISDLLIGIRESAIFAKNTGGISDEQVQAEQDAVDSAIAAIDRIAATTRFGRRDLLNGSAGFVTSAAAGITNLDISTVFLGGTSQALFTAQVLASASQALVSLNTVSQPAAGAGVIIRVTGTLGSEDLTFQSSATQTAILNAINAVRDFTGVYASGTFAFSEEFGSDVAVQIEVIRGAAIGGTGFGRDEGVDANVNVNGAQVDVDGLEVRVQSLFVKASFTVSASVYSSRFGVTDFSGLVFQLGSEPKASDQIRIGIAGTDSSRLGFEETTLPGPGGDDIGGFLSSLTAGGDNDLKSDPTNAIRILDRALDQVNGLRGYLGALQAQTLEPNERSLGVAVENLTATESSIRDLDFAAETSAFTRHQILFNAGTAVLASANLIPQQVLSLLQG